MLIGYTVKTMGYNKVVNWLLNLKLIPFILLASLTCALIFLNGYINMRSGEYALIPLFWVNVFLSCIVGINISKTIDRIFDSSVIKKLLLEIGMSSIVYLCLNQIVIKYVSVGNNLLESATSLLITVGILYIISMVITQTPLRLIIGKPVKKDEII